MLKHTHIRETELAKLRTLRNELAAQANYEKHQRLRQQAEAETITDYWHEYNAAPKYPNAQEGAHDDIRNGDKKYQVANGHDNHRAVQHNVPMATRRGVLRHGIWLGLIPTR